MFFADAKPDQRSLYFLVFGFACLFLSEWRVGGVQLNRLKVNKGKASSIGEFFFPWPKLLFLIIYHRYAWNKGKLFLSLSAIFLSIVFSIYLPIYLAILLSFSISILLCIYSIDYASFTPFLYLYHILFVLVFCAQKQLAKIFSYK